MRLRAAVVLLTVAFAGCGSDGEEAADVTRGFLRSVAAQNAQAACGELARSTREKLEKDEMSPCPEALETVGISGEREVTGSDVFGMAAMVSLSGGEYAFLDKTPEGWRISAAGCRPAGPEEPYDCELES